MPGRSYVERYGMTGLGMLPSTLVYSLDKAPSQAQWETDHGLKAFGVGSSGPAVATIRRRLAATGISEAFGNPEISQTYDNVLSSMVLAFRQAMGMAPGSTVDYETWFVLNQRAYETARGIKSKLVIPSIVSISSTQAEDQTLLSQAFSFDVSGTARAAWNRGAQLFDNVTSWFGTENAKPPADEQRETPSTAIVPTPSIIGDTPAWVLPVAGVLTAIVVYRAMNAE